MILLLPIIAALLAGGFCGLLGYYIDRLGIVTLGFSIAHAALAGAAIGMVLGIDMTLTASLMAISLAGIMGVITYRVNRIRDLVSMAFFSFFNALALFMIYITNTTVLATSSVATILWGSVLAITYFKASILAIAIIGFTLYVIAYKHHLDSILFDKKLAEAEGIDVHTHTIIILLFVGIAIALTLKLTGGFLVFTLLYSPVVTAIQVSRRAYIQQILSPIIGAVSAILGLGLSYLYNWPVGACIAIVSSTILVASALSRIIMNTITAMRAVNK